MRQNKKTSPRALVSVINDLSTDQRVARSCNSLVAQGYDVHLVGRQLPHSLALAARPYSCHRMRLCFTQGPLFYLLFQIRLLWHLLWQPKAQLYYANDLDTLLPNYMVARLKKGKLIYDSHELFTEVPELLHSPMKRKLWLQLERWLVPKADAMITVNQSIADIFEERYQRKLFVVRNIPPYDSQQAPTDKAALRNSLHLPLDKHIVILQGAGINIDRGAEEAVEAMQYVEGVLLLIVGSGDVIAHLKAMRTEKKLNDKVMITGKVPYQALQAYTRAADLGISLDKDTNLNYRYSLPNKLFDYIHAGLPVLATSLVEISRIIHHYDIGHTLKEASPQQIAHALKQIFSNEALMQRWRSQLPAAQQALNWQKEEQQLRACIEQLKPKNPNPPPEDSTS